MCQVEHQLKACQGGGRCRPGQSHSWVAQNRYQCPAAVMR